MTAYALKPAFQTLLRPLVGAIVRRGVTANQITLLAVAMSAGYGIAIWWAGGEPVLFALLPVLLFVRMGLNVVDGMLAREHGQASRLGAVLNEVGDLVSDAALILPFMLVAPFTAAWMVAITGLVWLCECVGILGAVCAGERRYEGPMGKSDRAVVFGILGVLVWATGGLSPVLWWFQPILCASLAVTTGNRLRAAIQRGN